LFVGGILSSPGSLGLLAAALAHFSRRRDHLASPQCPSSRFASLPSPRLLTDVSSLLPHPSSHHQPPPPDPLASPPLPLADELSNEQERAAALEADRDRLLAVEEGLRAQLAQRDADVVALEGTRDALGMDLRGLSQCNDLLAERLEETGAARDRLFRRAAALECAHAAASRASQALEDEQALTAGALRGTRTRLGEAEEESRTLQRQYDHMEASGERLQGQVDRLKGELALITKAKGQKEKHIVLLVKEKDRLAQKIVDLHRSRYVPLRRKGGAPATATAAATAAGTAAGAAGAAGVAMDAADRVEGGGEECTEGKGWDGAPLSQGENGTLGPFVSVSMTG
jgi:hypothetical protein